MNPLSEFLAYGGIAFAALGEEFGAGVCFSLSAVAQAAPAFLTSRN